MRCAALLALLVAALAPAAVAAPVRAASGHTCVGQDSAAARAAGDSGGGQADEDSPPRFTASFSAHTLTLDVSVDGLDGADLPVSIESICDVPRSLARQAQQLAGGDGVALIGTGTSVWQGKTRLSGSAATAALDGADTAVLRVRLAPRRSWREDEDGDAVTTFRTGRITITD